MSFHSHSLSTSFMAPRKSGPPKWDAAASSSSTSNRRAEFLNQSASSSSAPVTSRRSSRRQANTTSSVLTQNATKSNSDSVDDRKGGDNISEDDSDFQSTSTSGPSTVKGSTGKMAGSKRGALGETTPVTYKKQKQEEEDDLLEVDDSAIDMDQESDHGAEDSGLDDVGDPEFNPDYYSSDDDQEWIEVPVPGQHTSPGHRLVNPLPI